jgi:signal transduction histidine kinase
LYFHLAGEAYALVSIGLISFAAVAQFAPAVLGGMYWKGGTRNGALAGLLLGFVLWAYTLMLPSLAKSGWVSTDFLQQGPWGIAWLKPEAFLGLSGLDNLTHSLFWSLFANVTAYVWVSLWRRPAAREASQALLFVDVFQRTHATHPVFWQGQAKVTDLLHLMGRFLGETRAEQLFIQYARQVGVYDIGQIPADAKLVHFVETQLTGAIGSASARVMVASVVEEDPLELDDVMRILEEASELRIALEKLKSLDHLKDDFMSSVTHELRTPLTSIRALSEMMQDDPDMEQEQRQQFLGIVVAETERLSRLVNQVLDMAKIEAGHAEWHNSDVDMRDVVQQAVNSVAGTCRERQIALHTELPATVASLRADADRLVQVVLNLLSNALKFVPALQGEIVVRLLDAPAGVTVTVTDNGVGIAPDKHDQVFEKFRQVDNESGSVQGTGLGLPISRQIVEHFGGRMWLESEEGKGACFGFFLPR